MNSSQPFESRSVVTAFLRHQGKLLLVRRSHRVGTYRGRWSAISGYLEQSPYRQALQEIAEETGLTEDDVELAAQGPSLHVPDPALGVCWIIYPFLFEVRNPANIRLDWENVESRWVAPTELDDYATVPALKETLARCLAPGSNDQ